MDEILVKRTLNGDKAAFNQLVAKYQTQVYGLAVNILIVWIGGNEVPIHLQLSNNQISDINPLVKNSGISEGHAIDLRGNPLNDEAYNIHIPALKERGVKVLFASKP